MTVQAQTKPVFGSRERTTVRGLKGWIVGIAALAAAGAGIGFTVASSDSAPAVDVIAPVSENPVADQRAAYQRLIKGDTAVQESEVEWYLPGKPGIK